MTVTVPEEAVRGALGDVEELESLGGGGQGHVWRVRESGEDTVVKVIPDIDLQRVEREVASLKALSSPRVMRFLDSLEIPHTGGSWPGIRGEFVAGGTVADRIEADDWPSEEEALTCARGVLEGVAELHAHELVHRDIKPGNIALRDGAWGEPVVLDLGLVRDLAGTSITHYPSVLGTLPYMAPEQLRGERAVQRTDVFAVGVLLFNLLTRELPYYSESEDAGVPAPDVRLRMQERTEQDDWPRWARVQDQISADVGELLSHLLQPDAFARPRVEQAIDRLNELVTARS